MANSVRTKSRNWCSSCWKPPISCTILESCIET